MGEPNLLRRCLLWHKDSERFVKLTEFRKKDGEITLITVDDPVSNQQFKVSPDAFDLSLVAEEDLPNLPVIYCIGQGKKISAEECIKTQGLGCKVKCKAPTLGLKLAGAPASDDNKQNVKEEKTPEEIWQEILLNRKYIWSRKDQRFVEVRKIMGDILVAFDAHLNAEMQLQRCDIDFTQVKIEDIKNLQPQQIYCFLQQRTIYALECIEKQDSRCRPSCTHPLWGLKRETRQKEESAPLPPPPHPLKQEKIVPPVTPPKKDVKLCTKCHTRPADVKGLCRPCYMKDYLAARKEQEPKLPSPPNQKESKPQPPPAQKKTGLCSQCGKKPAVIIGLCRTCYNKPYREAYLKKKKAQQGAPPPSTTIKKDQDEKTTKTQKIELCPQCGEKPITNKKLGLCRECSLKIYRAKCAKNKKAKEEKRGEKKIKMEPKSELCKERERTKTQKTRRKKELDGKKRKRTGLLTPTPHSPLEKLIVELEKTNLSFAGSKLGALINRAIDELKHWGKAQKKAKNFEKAVETINNISKKIDSTIKTEFAELEKLMRQ